MDNLFFSVKTGIKSIVGKDLITDDNIAVFELVKNSYDAHATKVIITFEDDKIIIADNGKGMSLKDIEEKWLALAYSAKKDGTEDTVDEDVNKRESYRDKIQERRFYAGAKGIGRFSSDRLGTSLRLVTKTNKSNVYEQLDINWEDFEKNDKEDFINIVVPHKSLNNYRLFFPDNSKHGTILEIFNTKKWNRKSIKELKHSLEKLINPFSETNDFEIEITCEKELEIDKKRIDEKGNAIIDRDIINGKINNSILEVIKLKTTEIKINVTNEFIETELIDRGSQIYKIRERNKFNLLIDNMKVNLYYLNRGAKVNFGKIMGIQPVNYGSVFLFKNGFRVQPYGDTGDDSWGLDFRAQQGHSRTLGTRDLFGRVDIISENTEQFKEVSSRDGGLVETMGYHQLMDIFKEKGHKRLERYVVGVLWGEAFLRKKYFKSDNEGLKFRENLVNDKDSDEFSIAKDNIGSKIDFIQLLKGLTDEKDIEILEYNKDLVDLVNENLEEVQPKFLKDLEKIADKINDDDLKRTFDLTQENFHRIEKEKEEAEKKASEEERKRKIAEEIAKEEVNKRKVAEQKADEEEEKRRLAELETLKKEKERAEAELAKIIAEQKAKEEQEISKKLADKNSLLNQEVSYFKATRKTLTGDDAEQLVHSIDLYVGNASSYLNTIFEKENGFSKKTREELYFVKSNLDKALKVSQIIIKSDFDYKSTNHKVDLAKYIDDYFKDCAIARKGKLNFKIKNEVKHIAYLSTLDIDIIIDNLISNSIKASSSNILVELYKSDNKLIMDYYDDGIGLSSKFIGNKEAIFELGTRDSEKKGSGIGMYDINKRLGELKGSISILNNNTKLKGAGFRIIF
jgi:signal transduction histidine kinase